MGRGATLCGELEAQPHPTLCGEKLSLVHRASVALAFTPNTCLLKGNNATQA